MYKILSIGNSFSQDATAYLHKIAASAGIESKVLNLYIGGCSLERHVQNIENDAEAYSYMLNCDIGTKMIKMSDALCEEDWDFVTIQQVSHFAGIPETYFPYINILSDYVTKLAPNSPQIIHQTWAYESTYISPKFERYGSSQIAMYTAVIKTYSTIARKLGLKMIRAGDLVQQLRSDPIFDIKNSGRPITRDGFHLSIPYGRYAAALLWFKVLMGGDVYSVSFIPSGADAYIINRIKRYVHEFEN